MLLAFFLDTYIRLQDGEAGGEKSSDEEGGGGGGKGEKSVLQAKLTKLAIQIGYAGI